jgi:uroporphyrinogen-III synthase
MRSVLVTRPQPAADELAAALRQEGFEVFLAPMTEYVELPCDIGEISRYQALVFTSAQAAAIFAAREQAGFDMPAFAVGDATALAASKVGFRKVYSAQGDSGDMLRLLREKKETYGLQRILHVCGEDTAQDLAAPLEAEGIALVRAPVYKAQFKDTLPEDIDRALAEGDIGTVTLFSARTAAHFARILQRPGMKGVSADLEAVCLSARVAAELKPLPWRRIQVAKAPRLEAVLDILRTADDREDAARRPLPAEPVIAAFGGLRPLATRLDITPSTVQGWRKRGIIPATRAAGIRQAAMEDGIDLDILWKKEDSDMSDNSNTGSNTGAPPKKEDGRKHEFHDRRVAPDRRVRHSPVDRRGNVHGDDYQGADRRSGIDRRAYNERQAQRIRDEKWRFVNSMMIKGSVFAIVILYAGAFLLAPDFKAMQQNADRVAALQARIDSMNERLRVMQAQKGGGSIGNAISNTIGKMEDTTTDVGSTLGTMGHVAKEAAQSAASAAAEKVETLREQNGDSAALQSLQSLLTMWGQADKMQEQDNGKGAFTRAMAALHKAMAQSGGDIDSLSATLDGARRASPELRQLLGNVDAKDLGAAAMLLALNEFRSNVGSQRPFAQDLMLLHKFTGDDPEMQAALLRLAPYAERGVLNPQALQTEFKGLASDIVMAKLKGQDLSVKQEMLARLGKLVKVRRIDDIDGDTVDAKVARAQLMLDKGDVQGALQELQSLQGAPAQAATPFMNDAEGTLAADNATDALTQMILQQLSGKAGFSLDALFHGAENDSPETLSGKAPAVPYLSPALQDDGGAPFVRDR